MEKLLAKSLLFDIYGELLTEKQREVYETYYLNDFSLNEIADEWGVTPQAVRDLVKRTDKTLDWYEEKLKMVEKHEKLKNIVDETMQYANLHLVDEKVSKEIVSRLTDIMNWILE